MTKLLHTFTYHEKDINCCAFSTNGKLLASASNDKTVRIVSMDTGKELLKLQGHLYAVTACLFSPFSSAIVTGSQDCNIIVWDAESGEKITTLIGHKGIIRCLTFTANSHYLASCSSDETLCLWNFKTYQLMRTLRGSEFSLSTCRFTPDDLYVVAGSTYGDIRMWDVNTGKCVQMTQAHDCGVSGVGLAGCDFSPTFGAASQNGLVGEESPCFLLGTCGGDYLVKLWNVYTASAHSDKCGIRINMSLEGHSGHVSDCKFSSNGKLLASCSTDKTVILWEIPTGKLLTKLSGHSRYINTVALSADTRYLATGSNDKTVQLWLLDPKYQAKDDLSTLIVQEEERTAKRSNTWSVDKVCMWLQSIGLDAYCEVFRANAIDGTELSSVDDQTLANSLGIAPLGHRNKILRELKQLKEHENDTNVPDEFLCPITRELMTDPVILADGYTYERSSISEWLMSGKDTSPMTNTPLEHKRLVPNRSLKSAILHYFGPAPLAFCPEKNIQ